MGQGVSGLSCCSSESTTACIDRDIGCKDFCLSADDMRPPEDEWTPMQVASLEASDFERIDPWTSPLSVAQLQAERNGGLMSAMAVKKAPVTRAPPDYLADTPGDNTIVWNKAHDGHILADWPNIAGGSKVPPQSTQEEFMMKEVQRRAESNSLLAACKATEDAGTDLPAPPGVAHPVRSELRGARGERRNLAEQEEDAATAGADEVLVVNARRSAPGSQLPKDGADAFRETTGKIEPTSPCWEADDEHCLPSSAAAPRVKVSAGGAAEGDAAGGDAAGGAAPLADAEWVASWQVSQNTASAAVQDPPTARAAKQQAEIQRLRMELERLEALHNSEFTGAQAKPPHGQGQSEVLPPLAAIGQTITGHA